MIRRSFHLLAFLAAGLLPAQVPPAEPEVRRAIPVHPADEQYNNPEWINRVQPTPAPTPTPDAAFTPYRPETRSEPAPAAPPPVDADGVIRLGPSGGGAQSDLERANGVYARKMYDYAVTEYEKFLISNPSGPGRDQALFRLGESHRLLGNEEASRAAYQRLTGEFQKGEFAGAAAFRLGEFAFAEGRYDTALRNFSLAASQGASDEVRLSALYQEARSLEKLDRPVDAIDAYRQVLAVTKNNPYRAYARLSLASLQAARGARDEALASFEKIVAEPGPTGLRAEAAVKGGALAAEMGRGDKAAQLFDKALDLPDLGDWKPIAVLGALRTYYSAGQYKKVTALSQRETPTLPVEVQAEALLLEANAFRQDGNPRAARAVYDRLLTKYPETAQSGDAMFQRLVSLYQTDDPNVIAETDKFLESSTDPRQRAQASLLKAEALFKQQNFDQAGPLYSSLLATSLDANMKGKILMKLGWCQYKTGRPDAAVETYTTYLDRFPDGDSAVSATTQRGLARQETKNYDGALSDFERIITKFPKAREREFALQQKALILGQRQDYDAMTAVFQQLLNEYPKSAGAAQANFWIGWGAFEKKNYKAAVPSLDAAIKADPNQYGERAGLRLILCNYYLEDRAGLIRAIGSVKAEPSVEVVRWLGRKSFEDRDYRAAEMWLLRLVKDGKSPEPDVLIELAEAQIKQGRAEDAGPTVGAYLAAAREPYARARGLLAQARVWAAQGRYDDAVRSSEEALLLQPEGPMNAEARLTSGDIAFARGDFDTASKTFMTVAVLYDDPAITPQALKRAGDAYRKLGNIREAEKAARELQQRFPNFDKSPKITKENT